MSNPLAFKCYLKNNEGQDSEIRRFTIDSDVVGNFTYLKEKVRAIYPQLLRENFNLMYIDDEDDVITISSDEELVAALMCCQRKETDTFRLIIKLTGASKPSPAATSSEEPSQHGNCKGDIHIGVTCDGCQGAVRGFRYKCVQCPDFDLCGKCETLGMHPGHTLIRITGSMPFFFPALRNMMNDRPGFESGSHPWRRRHHGRSGHCNPHRGRWNAWCPSGVDVDPEASAETNKPSGGCPFKANAEQAHQAGPCPFKTNMDQAKKEMEKAAQAFQANGPEFLQGIGSTIASILEQFGIDTQIDIHGPSGACPRAEKKEAAAPKAEEEKPKEEPVKKEVIIPVAVEKADKAEPAVVVIPIAIEKEAPESSTTEREKIHAEKMAALNKSESAAAAASQEPAKSYAELAEAAAAVAEAAAARATPDKSPSRDSGDWTLVGDVEKAKGTAELGARPKSPQKQPEAAPLHPNPVVAAALETMLSMGFTNEGGWLSQLLEVKGGDIGKTLDVLHSQFQQRQQ